VPPLPEHTQLQELETALGVQAILVVHAPELDLRAWGETVAQMEEAGMLAGADIGCQGPSGRMLGHNINEGRMLRHNECVGSGAILRRGMHQGHVREMNVYEWPGSTMENTAV